jgi:hypothetical protein
MLATTVAALSFNAPIAPKASMRLSMAEGVAPDTSEKPWTSSEISNAAGLKELSIKLNPVVGYWDPLNIGETSPENIAWFRHAEIKHGRVAMAAFVGYCIQANGIHFPWNLQGPIGALNADLPVISFGDISAAGGPSDQWDALPSAAKLQILGAVGFLEMWGEASIVLEKEGQAHYVRGGKPGYYPSFDILRETLGQPPLNLFDPFGLQKKMTPEKKEKALLAELNNGRLAMIGIFGLISASKGLIVPGLDTLGIPKYAGEPMAFFSSVNSDLPYVSDMLGFSL